MEEKEKYEEDDDDIIPVPPDGGWGWMVVLASLTCNFIVDGISYTFGVLLPVFVEHFGESKGKVSLIGSLLFGVYLCSGPIASGLVNKFGCRAVTITGSIVASIGFLLGSFANSIDVLILTYGLLGGLGFGMIYLPSIVTVGYYFEKKRALATGIAMCGSGIGTFVFSPLNDFLLDVYGWRNLLFLYAGIILNGIVCGMLMRPLTVVKKGKTNKLKAKHLNKVVETSNNSEQCHLKGQVFWSELDNKNVLTGRNDRGTLKVSHSTGGDHNDNETNVNETLSQGIPLIVKEIVPTHRTTPNALSASVGHKLDYARPMYRKDIFYSGSLDHIPQYRSQPDIRSYVSSMISIPGVNIPEKSSVWDKCTCLPKTVTDVLKEMLDFSLMLKISFFMLWFGNLFVCTGYFIPFSYIVDQSEMIGINSGDAAFLISIMGISNTVGRVLCGFLADLTFVNPLVLNNVMLIVSAVALFVEPFCTSYATLVVFSVVFGLCIAAYISLTSPIICDLLSVEKLSNAFGLITLARGTSGIYGPPLAGAVFQATQNYSYSFYLGGGVYLAGAICHMVLHSPCTKKDKQSVDMIVK